MLSIKRARAVLEASGGRVWTDDAIARVLDLLHAVARLDLGYRFGLCTA